MKRQDTIRKMRATLLQRRASIRRSLDLTYGQLQPTNDRDVGDAVDMALDAEHHELSSHLAEVESAELQQIGVALDRMASGDYGFCVDCGRSIPLARLQAVPYATHCIQCQRDCETGVKSHHLAELPESMDRGRLLNGNGAAVA